METKSIAKNGKYRNQDQKLSAISSVLFQNIRFQCKPTRKMVTGATHTHTHTQIRRTLTEDFHQFLKEKSGALSRRTFTSPAEPVQTLVIKSLVFFRLWDTAGEGEVGMIRENIIRTYTLPYVKQSMGVLCMTRETTKSVLCGNLEG